MRTAALFTAVPRRSSGEAGRDGAFALRLVGAFKLLKGLALVVIGAAAIRLLQPDFAHGVASWALELREHRYVNRAVSVLLALDPRQLRAISAGVFAYAALLLVEGAGLILRQRWAEYVTLISTACFIPLECWEIAERPTATRFLLLGINVVVVWYLAARARGRWRGHRGDHIA